jgi:predicted nucleic acid-binding protein
VTDAILDTSIIIDLTTQKSLAVAWFNRVSNQRLAITPVVWLEVVEGARNLSERAQIMRFLRQFPIEHPIPDDNDWTMLQYSRFKLSHGIEWEDIMIASVAVRLAVPLYTLNLKDFAPLPNLDERQPY